MAHPIGNEHRDHRVQKSRVSHITKGYAHGGAVKHSDEKQDRKLIKGMIDKAIHPEGHKAKHRMDRPHRAKGGAVKKKGNTARTIVNVITGGHPAGGAVPPGPPMAPPAPPMGIAGPPPGGPPMAAKPPIMPPPGVGGPPGGPPMPLRAKGGRVHKPHGSPVFNEGLKAGTQIQHTDGKDDDKDIGRGRVVTFWAGGKVSKGGYGPKQTPTRAKGGRVESPQGIASATKMPGGGGGGKARLFKEHRAERDYAKPAR